MHKAIRFLLFSGLLLSLDAGTLHPAPLRAGYPSAPEVESRLRALAGEVPGATVIEYGRSLEGRPLLALEIARGAAPREARPAVLVVAGLEPTQLHGAEVALAIAGGAGAAGGGADPLEKAVLYVIADANPDGRTRVLAGAAEDANARGVDDDRDGRVDEDGPDDLDGDGLVRWLRIYRVGGLYRADSTDARASVRADPARGEAGSFDLAVEGHDDDRDGDLNEDGPGGVNLNGNFPYDYQMFAAGTGAWAVSEPESKALADFVIAHPGIGTALVLASDDNLDEAPKAAKGDEAASDGGAPPRRSSGPGAAPVEDPLVQRVLSDRSPVKGILQPDLAPYERAAARYAAVVGSRKNPRAESLHGSLADWLRYYQGIFSVAAPGWVLDGARDSAAAVPDSARGNGGPGRDGPGAGGAGKSIPDDRRALRSLEQAGVDAFAGWREVKHPDYPGRRVEVGGLDPLVFRTPPHSAVDSLGVRHAAFVREVLGWVPELTLEEPVVETLSPSVYRIRTEVANVGYLPTALYQGVRSRKSRPVRLDLGLPDGARLLSGQKVTLIPRLAGGGGHREVEWVVQAPAGSRMPLDAACPRAGRVHREARLP